VTIFFWYISGLLRITDVTHKKTRRKLIDAAYFQLIYLSENRSLYNVGKKYGRARQDTDADVTRRMRISRCIPKATDTHTEYVILLFHGNNGYAKAPQCYVYTYIVCPFLWGGGDIQFINLPPKKNPQTT
jgi:hypothetical protein